MIYRYPFSHDPAYILFRINKIYDYRKIVHYPKDGQYTIKKLPMTKLGGRHPVTGQKVIYLKNRIPDGSRSATRTLVLGTIFVYTRYGI
jgi:hypothetical protein